MCLLGSHRFYTYSPPSSCPRKSNAPPMTSYAAVATTHPASDLVLRLRVIYLICETWALLGSSSNHPGQTRSQAVGYTFLPKAPLTRHRFLSPSARYLQAGILIRVTGLEAAFHPSSPGLPASNRRDREGSLLSGTPASSINCYQSCQAAKFLSSLGLHDRRAAFSFACTNGLLVRSNW